MSDPILDAVRTLRSTEDPVMSAVRALRAESPAARIMRVGKPRTDIELPAREVGKAGPLVRDLPRATPEEAARLREQDQQVQTYAQMRGYDPTHYLEQGARSLVNAVPEVLAGPFDMIDRLAGGGEGLSGAGQIGSAIRSLKREDLPDMEKIPEGRFSQQLGGGLGMVATTVAAPELMGLKGAPAVTMATGLGAAPVAVGNYQRVLEATGDRDLAADAMLKGFGVAMAGGALPLGRILKRIDGVTNGAFLEALGDAAVFGAAGTGQEYVNNAILEHATGEELNTLSHLAETGGMNALIGVLTSAAGHAIGMRPVEAKATDTAPVEPPMDLNLPKDEPVVVPKPEAVVEEPRVVVKPPEVVVEPTPAEAALEPSPQPSQEPSQASVTPEPPPAPTPSKPEAQASTVSDGAGGTEPVGIRNASMERTAAELGVEPGKRGPKLTDQAAHDEAMRLVKADAETPRRLISELEASDRPPNKVEYAVLNIERRRIENERVKARDEYRNAKPEEREAKAKRVDEVTAEFNRVKDVFARLGTRSGQGLQARAAMLADDYSLAQMEFELQRAKGDKPLTEADRAEVEQLYERVTKAREAVEALVADAEVKIAQSEAVRAFERTKRQAARGASRQGRGSIETWIERKANEARERMKARARTTFAGTDPQLLLDAAYIGADYIAKGVHKFSDWVTAMRADVPELTDADMREVYAQAVKVHEEGKQAVLQAEYDERAARNPALKAAITRAKNQAAHLFEKAQYGDFSKKERKPLPETPELVEARTELRRAQKEFESAKRRAEREAMTKTQKAIDATKQVVGATTDVLTSIDVSAVLRQGVVFSLGHPLETVKNSALMFRAFASEGAAERIQTIIENDPLYPKLEKAGLEFTGYGDTLSPQEENIRSRISKHIPFVASSQRAFVTYMNAQRMVRAKAMVEALPDTTPAEIKSIAEFVNDATGRGKLSNKRLDAGLELARLALFSPRLYLSRLNLLSMRPIRRAASARQRKQAAVELGRFAAGLAAASGLAWMLGAEIEVEDPKKADFGKFRFPSKTDVGDTRIDMTGGLSQYITLAARMGSGEITDTSGKTKAQNPVDTFTRFLRNKLNPPVGAAVDLIVGKNAVGEPTGLQEAAARMVIPLSVRDIVETMKAQGIPEGTAISILGLFGAGVQTYGPKK